MTSLSQKQMEKLAAEAKRLVGSIGDGESARDIMAQIYVDNLEQKSLDQGGIMADGILKAVEEFDRDYHEAAKNPTYIDGLLNELVQDKNLTERCNYWLQLATAVATASVALTDKKDPDSVLPEAEALSISEADATPELESDLREQAMEAIRNSGILQVILPQQQAALLQIEKTEETARLLTNLGKDEIAYRGVLSMLVYTKIKNGTINDMPVDMTAAQATAVVCAQVEQLRILDEVENGGLAVDIASILLGILGSILLITLAAYVMAFGVAFALSYFNLLLAIPACVVVITTTLHLFDKATDAWLVASGKVVEFTSRAIKHIVDGTSSVIKYVYNTVMPKVISAAHSVMEKIEGLKNGEVVHEAEMVTE